MDVYTKKTGCSRTTKECKEMEEKIWLWYAIDS